MNFTTIDNGAYAKRPDTQKWWETAFIRPMGSRFAQYLPGSAIQNPAFVSGMINGGVNYFQTRITPYVSPQYGYAMSSAMEKQSCTSARSMSTARTPAIVYAASAARFIAGQCA